MAPSSSPCMWPPAWSRRSQATSHTIRCAIRTRQPRRDSHRKAAKKAAAAAARVAKAQAEHDVGIAEMNFTDHDPPAVGDRAACHHRDLKQTARVLIAQRAKDPAVTDAMFQSKAAHRIPGTTRQIH